MTLGMTSRCASRRPRGHRRGPLGAALLALACLFALPACASAFTEPGFTGTFADFANCPADLPNVAGCLHSYLTGGVIQIAHASVPVSVPGDTLDLAWYFGGVGVREEACEAIDELEDAGTEGEGCVLAPTHGILNGPAQPVPGGLLGGIGDGELTAVQARLEWAPSVPADMVFGIFEGEGGFPNAVLNNPAILSANGPAVELSLRIHLINPFLGPACYIGSPSSPIALKLTDGRTSPPLPNEPIAGEVPEFSSGEEGDVLLMSNLVLVDNSFSVPAATGCGTSGGGLLDAAIDEEFGLPSPAGQNAVVIDGKADVAATELILEHGWGEEPPEPAAQEPLKEGAAMAEPSIPDPVSDPLLQGAAPQTPSPLLASPPPAALLATRAPASTPAGRPACRPRRRLRKVRRCTTHGTSHRPAASHGVGVRARARRARRPATVRVVRSRASSGPRLPFAPATWAFALAVALGLFGVVGETWAALPDGRAYELVSPAEEGAVAPYAAVPSLRGEAVDFQARGAFAGAGSGSLNLYQATAHREPAGGPRRSPRRRPRPGSDAGAGPLFYSPDLLQTIFTTPASYTPEDEDGGALNLYLRSSNGALTWLSQGSEGASAPDEVTFDGATPDASSVVFSTAAALVPTATQPEHVSVYPEPEYLYDRLLSAGQTSLVNVNNAGEPVGLQTSTTLTEGAAAGELVLQVLSTAGFAPGSTLTVEPGGPLARTGAGRTRAERDAAQIVRWFL